MPLLNERHIIVHDTYHGKEIADPFRWLEERSSPETDRWIASQQRYAEAYFGRIPVCDHLESELSHRLDVETMDEPAYVAGTLFCRRRDQGQERSSIYARERGSSSWRLLVDANDFAPSLSINLYRVSSCASTLAFLTRVGGSDQASVHFLNVITGDKFAAQLDRGYARGLVLCPSRDGFFYCHERCGSSESHQILFRSFSADGPPDLVFERPRSSASKLILSGDENCLAALHVYECEEKRLSDFWVCDSDNPKTWRVLFEGLPVSSLPFIASKRLFLLTRPNDGGFAISELDAQGRELRIVAEGANGEVRCIVSTETHLYVGLQRGMTTEIRYRSLRDSEGSTITADAGEVVRLLPSPMNSGAVFFTRESHINPPVVFSHEPNAGCTRVFGGETGGVRRYVFETSYAAGDGTSIPATLIGKREGIERQPTVVLIYGAFGASLLPQFSVLFNLLTEMGVILALLHVRGGGENGRAWHDAGKKRSKPVSVSDVIDGVAWLRQQPFVDPSRIALYGASAGGLLVASVAMKIPQQLRAVVSVGPLLDMLRYDKFGLARRWRDEFGTSESSEDFEVLLSYSPYHNVSCCSHRPAFLFVTGDEDDRCDPAHVRKMAARLMETSCGDQPVIVDYSAFRGHTPGLSLRQRVATLARRCAFLAKELDLNVEGVRCA